VLRAAPGGRDPAPAPSADPEPQAEWTWAAEPSSAATVGAEPEPDPEGQPVGPPTGELTEEIEPVGDAPSGVDAEPGTAPAADVTEQIPRPTEGGGEPLAEDGNE